MSGISANDSYAIGADALRETWPTVLGPSAWHRKRFVLLAGIAAIVALLAYLIADIPQPAAGISTIAVGNFPAAVAVDPVAHTAYITTWDNSSVSVIDTETNKVTATVPVGDLPTAVAVDPAIHTAYTANAKDNTVSVINTATDTVTGTITVGEGPDAIAVDPVAHTAYITSSGGGGTVSVIKTG